MNKNQRMTIYIGPGLLVLVSAFPPWECVFLHLAAFTVEHPVGYSFLLSPAAVPVNHQDEFGQPMTPWGDGAGASYTRLNMPVLLVEWVTLTLVTLALVVAKRSPH